MVAPEEARRIALATDGYARNRFTTFAWIRVAQVLALHGYDAAQIESVLRSKYMRWAADSASSASDLTDFVKYWESTFGGFVTLRSKTEIVRLTLETFPNRVTPKTGSDLVTAAGREDVADLIDLARRVASDERRFRDRDVAAQARAILARIDGRAK